MGFAPTIFVPAIRPRSTRWKVDEKIADVLSLAHWAAAVLGRVTQSRAELGRTSGKEHRFQGVVNANVPEKTLSLKGP